MLATLMKRLSLIVATTRQLSSAYSSSTPTMSNLATPSNSIQRVAVVGGTHGNEYTGVWCIKSLSHETESLKRRFPSLSISTLLANPAAYLENKRFLDTDLNREFTEKKLTGASDSREARRAQEVNRLLGPKAFVSGEGKAVDVVVDLHTTTSNMGITIIVPEGDAVMAQAASYVLWKCGGEADCVILMHSILDKATRSNLSSVGKHGFTIEVGPVPQGVVRHDAVENTQKALDAFLEFLERRNKDKGVLMAQLKLMSGNDKRLVPCYRSAPAVKPGEMSGKIIWPSDADNPNFPAVMVHKSIQDRDFSMIKEGDPLFVRPDGSIIPYDGSHGKEVYLMFVNEGGYYYKSSGTGISVAVKAHFDLDTGMVAKVDDVPSVVECK